MNYRHLLYEFQQFLSEAEIKYDEFVGDSYVIDLDNLTVVASKHAVATLVSVVAGAQEVVRSAVIVYARH